MLSAVNFSSINLDAGINLNVQLLSLVSGAIVPLVVALVTKLNASRAIKTWVNVVLSAVGGSLALVIANSGHLVYKDFAYSILMAVIAAAGFHQGVYKPAGVTDAIQNATPNFGIGASTPTTGAPLPSAAPGVPVEPTNVSTGPSTAIGASDVSGGTLASSENPGGVVDPVK